MSQGRSQKLNKSVLLSPDKTVEKMRDALKEFYTQGKEIAQKKKRLLFRGETSAGGEHYGYIDKLAKGKLSGFILGTHFAVKNRNLT